MPNANNFNFYSEAGLGSMESLGDISAIMRLTRLVCNDVNGLMGKTRRNPLTGKISLRDVSHERDFTLVDFLQRSVIEGMPIDLADEEHLFLPRAMSYRTWVYHDRFKAAEAAYKVGGTSSEKFMWEALNERCIDFHGMATGLWSSSVIYFPTVPLTILSGDTTVIIACGIMTAFCMLVSVATNSTKFYFWARAITAPVRIAMLVIILATINGNFLKTLGYLIPFFAVMVDFWFGDMKLLCSGGFYCRYELVRALPNQVLICRRMGDNARIREPRKPLSEKMTGIMDSGQNEVCLIANLQGILVELVPVDANQDFASFDITHTMRTMNPSLPPVKFMGLDVFVGNLKSVHDYEVMEANMKLLKQRQKEARAVVEASDNIFGGANRGRTRTQSDNMKIEDV